VAPRVAGRRTTFASRRTTFSSVPVYIALVVAVFAVFRQVSGFEFVNLDDLTYVVRNPHVTSGLTLHGVAWAFTHAYEGYWAPLTWLSYMAEVQFFGLNSGAFHATSVVVHAANACLLFAALKRMTGAYWPSACVAALFAVHPLQVESVAWIAERKDVLSTFFYVLTIWAYARYVERRGLARYLLVVAGFACGLMSKPMIVTLPLVLILLDVWPLRRLAQSDDGPGQASRSTTTRAVDLVREKAPLLIMSLVVAVVTIVVQGNAGALASLTTASLSTRVANALVSCATYLAKMFWPSGLAALYPYPRAVPVWQAAVALLALTGISAGVLRGRERAPWLVVGWLWYLVTLVPVLGLIQAGPQARADRYTYVAMIGISIMAVWGIAQLADRFRYRRTVCAGVACVTLAMAGALAWQQVTYWRSTETVFRRALAVTSDNYVAHKGLGTVLLDAGHIDDAIVQLQSAVALAPDYGEALSDLGEALLAAGQPDAAAANLTRAVQRQPANPDFRVNLGSALYALGRGPAAEVEYREALRLAPDNYMAHSGLGLALAQEGDLDNARRELLTAIQLNPGYADAHLNLATILARMGRTEEASRAFADLARLNPGAPDAHIGLGTLLAKEGRMNEAIAELSIAVRMKPDDAALHGNLGIALVSAGRIEEGTAQLFEAVRLRPDLPELRNNLDLALAMRGAPAGAAGSRQPPPSRPR